MVLSMLDRLLNQASPRAWRWLVLSGSIAKQCHVNTSGELVTEQLPLKRVVDKGLRAVAPWDGDTAIVLGGSYCRQYSMGGLYACLPGQELAPEDASIKIENRCYVYNREWLKKFSAAALVLPFGEWVHQLYVRTPGWCCIEGGWLYVGGNGSFTQWPVTNPAPGAQTSAISCAPLLDGLPQARRLCYGAMPGAGWLADYSWQELAALPLITAWDEQLEA